MIVTYFLTFHFILVQGCELFFFNLILLSLVFIPLFPSKLFLNMLFKNRLFSLILFLKFWLQILWCFVFFDCSSEWIISSCGLWNFTVRSSSLISIMATLNFGRVYKLSSAGQLFYSMRLSGELQSSGGFPEDENIQVGSQSTKQKAHSPKYLDSKRRR